MTNAQFWNNSSAKDGGAVYATTLTTFTINGDSKFLNNTATAGGGALYATGITTLTLTNNQFWNNSAKNGGAIYAKGTISTFNISGGKFLNNTATAGGGAIYGESTISAFTISNSDFWDNTAVDGGALYMYLGATGNTLNLGGSKFINNVASSNGWILYARRLTETGAATYTYDGTAPTQDQMIYKFDSSATIKGSFTAGSKPTKPTEPTEPSATVISYTTPVISASALSVSPAPDLRTHTLVTDATTVLRDDQGNVVATRSGDAWTAETGYSVSYDSDNNVIVKKGGKPVVTTVLKDTTPLPTTTIAATEVTATQIPLSKDTGFSSLLLFVTDIDGIYGDFADGTLTFRTVINGFNLVYTVSGFTSQTEGFLNAGNYKFTADNVKIVSMTKDGYVYTKDEIASVRVEVGVEAAYVNVAKRAIYMTADTVYTVEGTTTGQSKYSSTLIGKQLVSGSPLNVTYEVGVQDGALKAGTHYTITVRDATLQVDNPNYEVTVLNLNNDMYVEEKNVAETVTSALNTGDGTLRSIVEKYTASINREQTITVTFDDGVTKVNSTAALLYFGQAKLVIDGGGTVELTNDAYNGPHLLTVSGRGNLVLQDLTITANQPQVTIGAYGDSTLLIRGTTHTVTKTADGYTDNYSMVLRQTAAASKNGNRGIYATGSANVTLEGVKVTGFRGQSGGSTEWSGAATQFLSSGDFVVKDSYFTNNYNTDNVTIYGAALFASHAAADVTVDNTVFYKNYLHSTGGSNFYGAAIGLRNGKSLTVTNSIFDTNWVKGGSGTHQGGALYTQNVVDVSIDNTVFTGNYAGYSATGGTIYYYRFNGVIGSLNISNSVIKDSTADYAAGIWAGSGWAGVGFTITISSTVFANNKANWAGDGNGGAAIYAYGNGIAGLTITDSTFINNIATRSNGTVACTAIYGGAIQAKLFSSLYYDGPDKGITITGSEFYGNTAKMNSGIGGTAYGGAMFLVAESNMNGYGDGVLALNISDNTFSNYTGKLAYTMTAQETAAKVTDSYVGTNIVDSTTSSEMWTATANYVETGNNNESHGGALYVEMGGPATFRVANNTFDGSYARTLKTAATSVYSIGGAVEFRAAGNKSNIEFTGNEFRNNYSMGYGGALGITMSSNNQIINTITLADNVFENNYAESGLSTN